MKDKDFNLVDQPWILALDLKGRTAQRSLLELFAQAHRLYGLAGEMPAQDIALLRLLLAILYAVFGNGGLDGAGEPPRSLAEARDRWQALWALGSFPQDRLEGYLRDPEIYERFYLFHPHLPFMQVVVDEQARMPVGDATEPLNPLVRQMKSMIGDLAESEHTPHLFAHRQDKDALSPAEAVRWLIHMNAYDVSPLGAPPRGSFRAKGFKEPWPNRLGLVWAQGNTLFETLLLNLVLAQEGQDPWQDFVPAWEQAKPFHYQDLQMVEVNFPSDPALLFTYPFRRLQLRRNPAGEVVECVLWGGHLVQATEGNPLTETMTLWRRDRSGNLVPRKHDPARQMWQDFGALFTMTQAPAPGVVSWLSGLVGEGRLDLPLLRLNTGGMVLSSKKTSIEDTVADSLRFHSALLRNLEEGWMPRITRELEITDKLVVRLGFLASNLARAAGESGDNSLKTTASKARAAGYFLVDQPFRQWLEGLDQHSDLDQACLAWRQTQQRLMAREGSEMVRRAGLKALVGRSVKEGEDGAKERVYAAPALYNQFQAQVWKILFE